MTDNRMNEPTPEQVEAAAQSAAPQADEEHFHIWSELPCKPGRCRMEPAPVLPSSGVGEDALAEAMLDAALARIAELEKELEVAMRPHSECERSGAEAGERIVDLEARIAELEADMERCEGLKAAHMRSVHETVNHNEELLARIAEAAKLHRESINSASALYPTTLCKCGVEYPCPTRIALGLNEGENDE